MVDRTKPRHAKRRAHVTWRTYDTIVRKTCLHVDGWLVQSTDDALYFAFITTAGGVQELARTMYRAEPGALIPVAWDNDVLARGVMRHVDSPWSRRNAPWLAALHWSHVYPTLRGPVAAPFKGFRSIMLRYVYSDPTLNDPCAGLENLYAVTGRKARDDAQRIEGAEPVTRAASPWNAAERSRLRTLDKLLK